MLRVLVDRRDVAAATTKFRHQLEHASDGRVEHVVGFPGGSGLARVWGHGFFFCRFSSGDLDNRSWNGFGLVMPEEANILPLVVEINMPMEGVNRSIAGVFLRGSRGELYVGHRGKIGGGSQGVSQTAFWRRFAPQAVSVLDDADVVRIGRLGSARLIADLATVVHDVNDIKQEIKRERTEARPAVVVDEFTPEFEGAKTYSVHERIEAPCHHGTIVRRLREALGELGWRVANDRSRDLVAWRSSRRKPATFEVKTDVSTQSIYTGVGQLVVHVRPRATKHSAVLVLPADVDTRTERLLAAEGISVLKYRWVDDEHVAFDDLDALAARLGSTRGR